jgi:hypothetical protein
LLSFASAYFFETNLFKGLQAIQIKNSPSAQPHSEMSSSIPTLFRR